MLKHFGINHIFVTSLELLVIKYALATHKFIVTHCLCLQNEYSTSLALLEKRKFIQRSSKIYKST